MCKFARLACPSLLVALALPLNPICAKAAGKPVIGINVEVSTGTRDQRFSIGADYIDAVTSAGGVPVILPPVQSKADIEQQLRMCDGFVLTGGRDIHPERYHQQSRAEGEPLATRREDFDFQLINAILRSRKPVLAVCLGCQEMNVALGGTLLQDIATQTSSTIDHHPHDKRHEPIHDIQVTTGSVLARIVGATQLRVNSVHHQACALPGRGVEYLAKTQDGIVEAYRVKGQPFALAVQWHPEAIISHPGQLKLYSALVRAAADARSRNSNWLR